MFAKRVQLKGGIVIDISLWKPGSLLQFVLGPSLGAKENELLLLQGLGFKIIPIFQNAAPRTVGLGRGIARL